MGTEEVEKKKHTWSKEWIYHFTCGSCKNWWSYACETEYFGWRTTKVPHFRNWVEMICPHCGHKSITETKLK